MITRRRFIKQAGVTGAGLLFAGPFLGKPIVASSGTVICIGAGLAGMAAAYKLKQAGYKVIVLESRNRVGGRVFSHQVTNRLVIELGGEWIGNSHTRMQELCSRFGLELVNNQLETHLVYKGDYFPAGKWDYSASWKKKWKEMIAGYSQLGDEDKQQLDKYDWWRYLVNNGCEGRDLEIRELLDSTDFGESIRHVSAFAALAEYAESSEKNEMDLKIKGGNQMLAEKFADAIGRESILLQHTVIKIDQKEKVTVSCSNGKVFTADRMICTLPTFALSKIQWQPGLPPEKTNAINELQYARINKHAVVFKERFWKDEAFDLISDETPHYFYHATKGQPGTEGVLISYTIGDKAAVMANGSNVANASAIAQTLAPCFGNIQPLIRQQVNYYWGTDAISQGAYALFGINQWFRLRSVLAKPFLHTHFAGEHLADWQGFMEGAVNTGEDAAGQII